MIIKSTLYNSNTSDLAIVIDLLRASTTMTVALDTFNEIIPVNNIEKAFSLAKKYDAVLAGEEKRSKIEGFDISNSPKTVQEYSGNTLILKTTNGTKVLENIKNKNPDTKILIGTAINAEAVAKKALEMADNEIELVMAGRRELFAIEDCIGAGIIINNILKLAKERNIDIFMDETSKVAQLLTEDENKAVELIDTSISANKLRLLNAAKDIIVCEQINKSSNVPIYKKHMIVNSN